MEASRDDYGRKQAAVTGMSDQQNLTIKDAEFTLDLQGERLWKGDQRISITNKAFQLLKLFAERPERLVSKEEILDSLWQDVYVTEGLVREYVHDLRAVLEDDAKMPRFIETVPRRGYRFLGGVAIRDGTAPQAILGSLEDGRPIVEVRPFEDLTDTVRSARLAIGLTDDLVTDLARFPDLAVVKASGETSATTGQTGIGSPIIASRAASRSRMVPCA
jgi:DNA-binding winged helix-turn-helix (wHTH) protein